MGSISPSEDQGLETWCSLGSFVALTFCDCGHYMETVWPLSPFGVAVPMQGCKPRAGTSAEPHTPFSEVPVEASVEHISFLKEIFY